MSKRTFILILLSLYISSLYSQENIVVAAADPWPPFVDPDNPNDGLCMEIISASLKTQGYIVKMKYVPWARAVNSVKIGKYDILPDVWYSNERSKFLYFSKPFIVNKLKFIKLKSTEFDYKDIESLKGKRVGTIRDFSYEEEFMNSDIFIREPTPSLQQNILRLIHGRVDLIIEDEIVAITVINKLFPDYIDEIEICEIPLSINNLYIACGYKNPRHIEIIGAFNTGLEEIKVSGLYDKIMESYFITTE